jgi:acetyl esterase/lipase
MLSPSLTMDEIPGLRANLAELTPPIPEELAGAFTMEERSVLGGEGAPEVSLLICRPASARAPVAALYWIHSGGMVMADNRDGLDEVLFYARDLELAVVVPAGP